jgi:hypothetical protein
MVEENDIKLFPRNPEEYSHDLDLSHIKPILNFDHLIE